jgi:hypothetical protein
MVICKIFKKVQGQRASQLKIKNYFNGKENWEKTLK